MAVHLSDTIILQFNSSVLTKTQNDTRLVPNESFYTIVGEGSVSGNQSLLDVGLGGIVADDFATGNHNSLGNLASL